MTDTSAIGSNSTSEDPILWILCLRLAPSAHSSRLEGSVSMMLNVASLLVRRRDAGRRCLISLSLGAQYASDAAESINELLLKTSQEHNYVGPVKASHIQGTGMAVFTDSDPMQWVSYRAISMARPR